MYGKSEDRDDYQRTPGPVAAMARDLPAGHHIAPHRHRRGQLIYGCAGAITVTTGHGCWVVPRHRAVWVPPGTRHAMTTIGPVPLRTLYLEHGAHPGLPAAPTVLPVTPLLGELVNAATRIAHHGPVSARDDRLMALLLDELDPRPGPVPSIHLPEPTDPALVRLGRLIRAEPGATWTLPACAAAVHLSPRTLRRRFLAETGYPVARWVRQARLLSALELLAGGHSVTEVSGRLGYDSPSAFSAMFRRELGRPPLGYF